jgi:ABC-type transport system involved in multi-copper enzyme maturation permease subunit
MPWYKSWLDTRWRFLIPLAILVLNIWGLILEYPHVANLLRTVHLEPDALSESGVLGRAIVESVAAERTYRGYIWFQWFRQTLSQMGTLFAVLLGSGSLLSGSSGGGTMFTLSLPASRNRWLAARAAIGLGESLALVLIPSLEISLVSPLIGQQYGIADAVVHAACLFTVGAVFFSLAFLLSTVFSDIWRPMLIACGVAVVVALCESRFELNGLFRVMSASTYFAAGSIPWTGLLVSTTMSAAMLYGASVNVARQDF